MAAYAAAYARALVDVVLGRKLDTQDVDRQLTDFGAALDLSPELREVLYNPSFKMEKRLAIVDQLATRMQLGREIRNFIAVVMRNSRLHAFREIVDQYRREMDKRSGIAEARITTARKLDQNERQALEARVATIAGSRVRATFEEDKALVGGLILRIGSTVYDGSVRGRLERMKEQLVTG
jgi:F-type H+-transporting ATPase subunit delta